MIDILPVKQGFIDYDRQYDKLAGNHRLFSMFYGTPWPKVIIPAKPATDSNRKKSQPY
jgi:hypothetical protein